MSSPVTCDQEAARCCRTWLSCFIKCVFLSRVCWELPSDGVAQKLHANGLMREKESNKVIMKTVHPQFFFHSSNKSAISHQAWCLRLVIMKTRIQVTRHLASSWAWQPSVKDGLCVLFSQGTVPWPFVRNDGSEFWTPPPQTPSPARHPLSGTLPFDGSCMNPQAGSPSETFPIHAPRWVCLH